LEEITRGFGRRKEAWRKPAAISDFINAAVGFVLDHVNFNDLESAEEIDDYVANRFFTTTTSHGGLEINEGTATA